MAILDMRDEFEKGFVHKSCMATREMIPSIFLTHDIAMNEFSGILRQHSAFTNVNKAFIGSCLNKAMRPDFDEAYEKFLDSSMKFSDGESGYFIGEERFTTLQDVISKSKSGKFHPEINKYLSTFISPNSSGKVDNVKMVLLARFLIDKHIGANRHFRGGITQINGEIGTQEYMVMLPNVMDDRFAVMKCSMISLDLDSENKSWIHFIDPDDESTFHQAFYAHRNLHPYHRDATNDVAIPLESNEPGYYIKKKDQMQNDHQNFQDNNSRTSVLVVLDDE
jgi:hypothetical protein